MPDFYTPPTQVLVETFEEGELITRYMEAETPGRYNKKLAGGWASAGFVFGGLLRRF